MHAVDVEVSLSSTQRGVTLLRSIDFDSCKSIPCAWQLPRQGLTTYPVCPNEALYLGEPLAVVVGLDHHAVEAAARSAIFSGTAKPALRSMDDALAPGASLLHPRCGSNIVAEQQDEDFEEVWARACRAESSFSGTFSSGRVAAAPLEPRGIVAYWDVSAGELVVWLPTQTPHHIKDVLSEWLQVPKRQVRVLSPLIGGAFGSKEHLLPEEAMVVFAAIQLGQPVRWIETRDENHLSSIARGTRVSLVISHTKGRFHDLAVLVQADVGARLSSVGVGPALITAGMVEGPYVFNNVSTRVEYIVTNNSPTGGYRGFGMQEATWARELALDELARDVLISAGELRRRNVIRRFPSKNKSGCFFDEADFLAMLERAKSVDADMRSAEPPIPPVRRGVGMCLYIEGTGMGPSEAQAAAGFRVGGYEEVSVSLRSDGEIVVSTGLASFGQQIEESIAMLVASELGCDDPSGIHVLLGDTKTTPYSPAGSIASRSIVVGGAAAVAAANRLRHLLLAKGSNQLGIPASELLVTQGRVVGPGGETRTFKDLASAIMRDGEGPLPEVGQVYEPKVISYGYGAHVASVLVDPRSAEVIVERICVFADCGLPVNEQVVIKQIRGGVIQGVGQTLLEQVVSFDDLRKPFLIPRSSDIPEIDVALFPIYSSISPIGIRGVGQSGAVAAPAAIGNAVADAFREVPSLIRETPIRSSDLWSSLRGLDAGSSVQPS